MKQEQNPRLRGRKKGDLSRKSTHKMRTHDGMVSSKQFVRTPIGMARAR
jgi:hypothetical protein